MEARDGSRPFFRAGVVRPKPTNRTHRRGNSILYLQQQAGEQSASPIPSPDPSPVHNAAKTLSSSPNSLTSPDLVTPHELPDGNPEHLSSFLNVFGALDSSARDDTAPAVQRGVQFVASNLAQSIGRSSGSHSLLSSKTRAKWVSDSVSSCCMKCGEEFTLSLRRHHCRGCGKLFCQHCSANADFVPAYDKVERTCDSCHDILKVWLPPPLEESPSGPTPSPEPRAPSAEDDSSLEPELVYSPPSTGSMDAPSRQEDPLAPSKPRGRPPSSPEPSWFDSAKDPPLGDPDQVQFKLSDDSAQHEHIEEALDKEREERTAAIEELRLAGEASLEERALDLETMLSTQTDLLQSQCQQLESKEQAAQVQIQALEDKVAVLEDLNARQNEQLAQLQQTQSLVAKLRLDIESLYSDNKTVKSQISGMRAEGSALLGHGISSSSSIFGTGWVPWLGKVLLDRMRLFQIATLVYSVCMILQMSACAPQRWFAALLFPAAEMAATDVANSTPIEKGEEESRARSNTHSTLEAELSRSSVAEAKVFDDEWAEFFGES